MIREIARMHGDITPFVPSAVARDLMAKVHAP
jgi:phosphopantetheine adenylyltransferase